MMTIAPNTPFMKQIRNISDVIYESNYEQNFTAQCVLRTHQTHPQEIPGHAATVPRTISVKKKKRVPKCEIVFARAALGRRQVLRVVTHDGIRHIDAFPARVPEPPAQVDILAIHEEKMFIESTCLLKCVS